MVPRLPQEILDHILSLVPPSQRFRMGFGISETPAQVTKAKERAREDGFTARLYADGIIPRQPPFEHVGHRWYDKNNMPLRRGPNNVEIFITGGGGHYHHFFLTLKFHRGRIQFRHDTYTLIYHATPHPPSMTCKYRETLEDSEMDFAGVAMCIEAVIVKFPFGHIQSRSDGLEHGAHRCEGGGYQAASMMLDLIEWIDK